MKNGGKLDLDYHNILLNKRLKSIRKSEGRIREVPNYRQSLQESFNNAGLRLSDKWCKRLKMVGQVV